MPIAIVTKYHGPTDTRGARRKGERAMAKVTRAVLVYQAGIANVFAVDSFNMSDYGREARRLMQGGFRSCEYFARGLAAAGVRVGTAHCNQAGDIACATWSTDLDSAPFRESLQPVWHRASL